MITKTESYLYSPPLAVSHWPPAEGLEKKQIAADSVQNPNDPDAEYRQKGQQKVKGYSVNITETTD